MAHLLLATSHLSHYDADYLFPIDLPWILNTYFTAIFSTGNEIQRENLFLLTGNGPGTFLRTQMALEVAKGN